MSKEKLSKEMAVRLKAEFYDTSSKYISEDEMKKIIDSMTELEPMKYKWKAFWSGYFNKWVWIIGLSLSIGFFLCYFTHEPATDSGDCKDVAKVEILSNRVHWDIDDIKVYNAEIVGYNYKDSCGYHWWDCDGKIHYVKPKTVNHTDTPEPVCPWCGETNYTEYYTKSESNKWGDNKYEMWCGDKRVSFNISHLKCNSCNKDFTITVREENKVYYTTMRKLESE